MMMIEPRSFAGTRGKLLRDLPLAKYTTWRCGGPADVAFLPADRDDLAAFVTQLPPGTPLTVIGLGSNVLVRDGGVRGAVVLMHAPGGVLAIWSSRPEPKFTRRLRKTGFDVVENPVRAKGPQGGAQHFIWTATRSD